MSANDTSLLAPHELSRYQRHLSLPDFDIAAQLRLKKAKLLMVGAGGLGAAALPYLAGAGIGHITIYDEDSVDLSNLHRQTIFKTADKGRSKAKIAAEYASALNPHIIVSAVPERLKVSTVLPQKYDLIFDGSDNFETKSFLNSLSVDTKTPLIGASVNQYAGQCGIFAGFASDKPCYHCLFPHLPNDARNCNEAGVMSTAAGLTGLYEAHMAILFLAGLNGAKPGDFLCFDFQNHRLQVLEATKDPECPHCAHTDKNWSHPKEKETKAMIEMLSMEALTPKDHIIVDVRTRGEIEADPIEGALHIEISDIPARHEELPKDKLLAFVCAGNIRSAQAAEYLSALGYDNVVVLDKFSL